MEGRLSGRDREGGEPNGEPGQSVSHVVSVGPVSTNLQQRLESGRKGKERRGRKQRRQQTKESRKAQAERAHTHTPWVPQVAVRAVPAQPAQRVSTAATFPATPSSRCDAAEPRRHPHTPFALFFRDGKGGRAEVYLPPPTCAIDREVERPSVGPSPQYNSSVERRGERYAAEILPLWRGMRMDTDTVPEDSSLSEDRKGGGC